MKNMMKKYGKNWICWLIWIGIWQLADLFIHNNVIFAGPVNRWGFLAKSAPLCLSYLFRLFKCFFPWYPSWKPWVGLSSGKRIFKTTYADDPLRTSGLFRHSGTDMDRIRKPVCFYFLSGGRSYDLRCHTGRT